MEPNYTMLNMLPFVAGFWYGALFYTPSTSVTGLQKIVTICEEHAKINNLEFRTDLDLKNGSRPEGKESKFH